MKDKHTSISSDTINEGTEAEGWGKEMNHASAVLGTD